MDHFLQPAGGKPSLRPKSQLHGARPSPLKLRRDSHKILKSPAAAPAPQRRPPLIIYAVSPKVIHTNPNEFMSLVQRLTGLNASSSSEVDAEAIEMASPNLLSPSVMDIMSSNFFLHELSPGFHESKGFVETAFLASPTGFFCSF